MNKERGTYFANLDGLRIILALIVFGGHSMLNQTFENYISWTILKKLITVFTAGHLAVSFFFVLSGFLITYLMLEEHNLKGGFSIKNFYLRRILRIWPLYFTVLTFSFGIYPFIKTWLGYPDLNPFKLLFQILFLANFDSMYVHEAGLVKVAPMMININWSVSIEEQFYLLWPIFFLLVRPKFFWTICCIVLATSWVFRFITAWDSINNSSLYYHTLSVISDMAFGGLTACMCFFWKSPIEYLKNLPCWTIVLTYLIGFSLLMYYEVWFSGFFIKTNFRIVSAVFFSFVILEQCYASNSFFKFGNFKTLSSLGKYSFGFYLLHPIGIQVAILTFRFVGWERDENFFWGFSYSLIGLTSSFFFAILSYHILEKYFLNLRKLFSYT